MDEYHPAAMPHRSEDAGVGQATFLGANPADKDSKDKDLTQYLHKVAVVDGYGGAAHT